MQAVQRVKRAQHVKVKDVNRAAVLAVALDLVNHQSLEVLTVNLETNKKRT
jgi:hypothetical protein